MVFCGEGSARLGTEMVAIPKATLVSDARLGLTNGTAIDTQAAGSSTI